MYTDTTVTEASLLGLDSLASLPAASRTALVAKASGRRYAAGEPILRCGDSTREVYFVASGVARVIFFSAVGREVVFRDMLPGSMFGELSALDGKTRSADVHALDDTFVVVLDHAQFHALLAAEPAFARYVLERMAVRVRDLSERVVEFSTLQVDARVRMELLRMVRRDQAQPQRGRLEPVPTHQDIANRIGTHREAVTRALAQLSRAGLIERLGAALVIPDLERLRALPGAEAGHALD